MRFVKHLTFVAALSCRVFSVHASADDEFGDDVDDDGGIQVENLPHLSQAGAVRQAFKSSWNAYAQYALGFDELLPVSQKGSNTRYGWGDSVIDGLSTAIVLELSSVVLQQLDLVCKIDFSTTKTSNNISLKDVTNRYLGGMLSAYDLLQGPYSSLIPRKNATLVDCLPKQAKTLADLLKVAFNTPSGVPDDVLIPSGNGVYKPAGSEQTPTGYIGWLVLEWTRLSDVLGDTSYAALAQKAENYMIAPSAASKSVGEALPGLIGGNLFLSNGSFADAGSNWGTDSNILGDRPGGRGYYEYMIKMYTYDPTKFSAYADRWITAAQSTIMYLYATTVRTKRPLDLTFIGEYQGTFADSVQTHGACSTGAILTLGGLSLRRNDIVKYGEKHIRSCREMYTVQPTRIGYDMVLWTDLDFFFPPDMYAQYHDHGFYAYDPSWSLKSEFVESLYYGYTITGKEKYRDWAWDAFKAINKTCLTQSGGFSGVLNTTDPTGGGFSDLQNSWWLSQTLKYFYLMFAENNDVGLSDGRRQDWVFNSDGHPLRTRRR